MKHGDLVRPGDEFNLEPWYHCDACRTVHGRDLPQCDGLRRPINEVHTSGFLRTVPMHGMVPRPVVHADPIAKAVDDYILMGRKARAWDQLMALYERHDTGLIHVDVARGLVHPAQNPSTC